jgi:hypothetical protein
MKSRWLMWLPVLAVVGWSGAAWAADANTPAGRAGLGLRQRGALRARLLEKFDTNKDGKLGDTEKAAAKKAIQEWRSKYQSGAGAGGAAGPAASN